MTSFSYKAKDRHGNTVTGVVEADSSSHAAAVLREQGNLPMDIRPQREKGGSRNEAGSPLLRYLVYPLWTGVNLHTLAFFFRQMAVLLNSGMTLTEALSSVGARAGGRMRGIVGEMRRSAEDGKGLSATILRHPRVFSPVQTALVRVGESTGMLSDMMDRAATYAEYELSMRRMISRMVAYPVVVVVFALVVKICVPNVLVLVDQGGGAFWKVVFPEFKVWLLWFLAVVIAMKWLFQFRPVKLVWDAVKIVPPVIGTAARKVAMSRFSRAVALLYSAGATMSETVSVGADACANQFIGGRIRSVVPALQTGSSLAETLESTGVVTPVVMDMLVTGERTGNTDATLEKVAEYMDGEVDATLHKLGLALMVGGIIAAGVVVLSVILELYQSYAGSVLGNAD